MRRCIFAVDPAARDAAEDALGALLGEGWGRGCLVPYPQPPRPDQGRPVATAYVCDVALDDDDMARVEALVAGDTSVTLVKAANERGGNMLREMLEAHAAKAVRGGGPESSPIKGA